jgi:hypothetical protein
MGRNQKATESAAGSEIMLKKSMLTMKTLDRFEKKVDVTLLTEDVKREIKYDAYCANMGRSGEDVWNWFRHLVTEVSPEYIPNFPRFSLSE